MPNTLDRYRRRAWLASATALVLVACGGGGGGEAAVAVDADSAQAAPAASRTATAMTQPASTEGRLLASNCFQCHGTLGLGGFDKIRGSEAKEVLEFAGKPAGSNIMAAHAQGYTPEQLRQIITYLQQ
ncbi:cytochrome c [Calidifontimicrobium sp. SYSU G02091]|uniref:c-type cytochrome n=1 Tax=Calidifontimicrobium sp. SYSU G02091 TaxID=2926421 RepID=UPI001F52E1B5|nr:cytochrome c [Calidifontimicrobium sp. SYSU G02091]MCI1191972.1 cytochrome c [Calidifontimicrobium sp. SYSU G02091]